MEQSLTLLVRYIFFTAKVQFAVRFLQERKRSSVFHSARKLSTSFQRFQNPRSKETQRNFVISLHQSNNLFSPSHRELKLMCLFCFLRNLVIFFLYAQAQYLYVLYLSFVDSFSACSSTRTSTGNSCERVFVSISTTLRRQSGC